MAMLYKPGIRLKRGQVMKRTIGIILSMTIICFLGCKAVENETESTYDDMTSKYALMTVSELWNALENSDEDYNGTYLLAKGVLLSVGTDSATLLDSDTQKAITCEFDSSVDLTTLKSLLANNGTDSQDIVTIGGVCHYYENTTSYPYLESCDYFYVNEDD